MTRHAQDGKPLDQDVASLLMRAQQIDAELDDLIARDPTAGQLLAAAEEAGIDRAAIAQALRERLHPTLGFQEGDRVFARSGDGRFYIARIQTIDAGRASVRFVSGAEASLGLADLRPLDLTPGTRIEAYRSDWYTWLEEEVTTINLEGGSVTSSYSGMVATHPMEKIRLPRERTAKEKSAAAKLWIASLTSGTVGAGLGALLYWLLTR